MNRHVYNIACLMGTIFCAVGAGLHFGEGIGLMVGGSLVLALTIYAAELSRRAIRRSDG